MTNDQYSELIGFLGRRFDSIDRRFEGMENRFEGLENRFEGLENRFETLERRTARVEVGLESLREEVRVVAEGVSANTVRIDRLERTMNQRFDRMELLWADHEGRIRALEG